ncbi:MAG: substrate-binding domain-containing protein [Oscillospiraceae bacterium]|nr:substrate-binding domain-containing protein [Oscillospiraceae bacterium]
MKKLIALLVVLTMLLGLAACGTTTEDPAPAPADTPADSAPAETTPDAPAEPEKTEEPAETGSGDAEPAASGSKGTIAVVCYVTSAPYFSSGEAAAIAAGEALGYDVIWTGTSEVDTAGLISVVENLISQGVDGICLASGDTSSMVPICQEAMSKGIKVVTFDLDIEPEGRDAYAGLDDLSELAVPQVESIVASIGEEGDVAVVTGVLTNELLQKRIERMYSYAEEKYPGLNFVTVEGTNEDSEAAYTAAMNIMTAYPDVDAIVSNVSTALGPIATAIEDAGMIGQVYACGQSSPNLAKPGMASGACVSAILWDTAKWQEWAVRICASLIEGTEYEVGSCGIDGFPQGEYVGDDVFYFYETFSFTPDNINDFDF